MDDIMWGKRRPGDIAALADNEPALIVAAVPDVVRLPAELGGLELRVQCAIEAKCPVCKAEGQRHVELEDLYGYCECVPCGKFHWYRRTKV